MNNAYKLYETFTKSTDSKVIIGAAYEIEKYFVNVSKKEPTDETGEELLYLLGGKKETFEWQLFLTILFLNDSKFEEYLEVLKNKINQISIEQSEWAKLILREIHPIANEDYFENISELIVLLENVKSKKTISTNSKDKLPDYLLIVCDKQPKFKNEFVKSIIESLDYSIGSNTLIETSQYNNAQSLKAALPFAIAFSARHFRENSLELDLDETKYSGFRTLSSGIPIYGYSFGMFSKAKDKKEQDEKKISFWQKLFGKKKTTSHGTSPNTQSIQNKNKLKDFEFHIVPISEYYGFFKKVAKEIGTTDPDVVYTKIRVYCERCNIQYKQEALEMLFALGTGGMFGGASTVVFRATEEGNDFRSGKCPKCGHPRMKILVHD